VPLEEYFKQNEQPRFLLGQGGDAKEREENLVHQGLGQQFDELVAFFDRRMDGLTSAQSCVVTYCVHIHNVFVLGVLLGEGVCTPEQYADGLLAVTCRIPGVFGGVTKRDALRARNAAIRDAALMLRFRDLADGHRSLSTKSG
jgi:hypothetical protein